MSDRRAVEASVVIRAKNEAAHVDSVLRCVSNQTLSPSEIIFVDSGSTDGTVEIAKRHGVRLVQMEPEDFTYGRALNLGIRHTSTPVVALLSAHALPASRNWFENLVSPLGNPEIGGVFGRQLAHSDCNPFERMALARAYPDVPCRYRESPVFSNANAAVRRNLVTDVPFDEDVSYSEDQIWARRVCDTGWEIVYEPKAAVYHSHNETLGEIFRRQRKETFAEVAELGVRTALARPWMLPLAFAWGVLRDWVRLAARGEHPVWWLRAPGYRAAKILGAFHGTCDAKRGTP